MEPKENHMPEFVVLRHLLRGYYYQTVWDDFNTNEEIWERFSTDADSKQIADLVNELSQIESADRRELMLFFNASCDGDSFDTHEELVDFLGKMRAYFRKRNSAL